MGCASSTPVVIADPAKPEELKPFAAEEAPVLEAAPSIADVVAPPTEVVATEEEKPVAKPSTEVVAAAAAPAAAVAPEVVALAVEVVAPEVIAPEVIAPEVVAPEVVAPASAAAPSAPAPAAAPPAPAISDEVLASYKEAFSVFDKDGSGTVSTSELGEMMSALGQYLSAEELDEMVKEVDADGSGEIDFDEFCACMLKATEGGATAPKLAVVVEVLSGLKNFFSQLFNRGPSAEEIAAAEAAAAAAAEAKAARSAAEAAAEKAAAEKAAAEKAAAEKAAAAEAEKAAAEKAAAEKAAAEAAAAAEKAAAEKAAAEAAAAAEKAAAEVAAAAAAEKAAAEKAAAEKAAEQKLLVTRQKSVDEGNVREPSRRERAPSSRRSSVPCAASTSASSSHSLPRDGDAVDGDADQQTQRAAVEPQPLPPQRILTRIVSKSLIAISSHVASSVASLSDPKLATELKIKALMGAETLDLVGLQKVIDEAERQEAVRKHSSLGATPEGGPEGYTDEAAATPTEIAEIAAIAGLEEAQQLYAAGKAATGGLERVLRDPPAVDAEYVRELRAAVDEYVRLKLPKGEALTAARAALEVVSTAVADVRKHMSVRPLDLAVLEAAIMEASRARVPGEDEAMVAAREVLEAGTQALKALNVEVNKVPINAKGLKKALEAAKEPLLAGREAEGVIEKAEALLEAVLMLLDVQLPPEHRAHLDTEMVSEVRCRDSLGFVSDCNVPRHALCAPVC